MQMGTISDKPLEAARRRLCLRYGNISCIGGCVHFVGDAEDGGILCKHEKKCCPEMMSKGRLGRYFTPTPGGLATVIEGATLVELAKAARGKAAEYYAA